MLKDGGSGDLKFKSGRFGRYRLSQKGFEIKYLDGQGYFFQPSSHPENYPNDQTSRRPLSLGKIWEDGTVFFLNTHMPIMQRYHETLRKIFEKYS